MKFNKPYGLIFVWEKSVMNQFKDKTNMAISPRNCYERPIEKAIMDNSCHHVHIISKTEPQSVWRIW